MVPLWISLDPSQRYFSFYDPRMTTNERKLQKAAESHIYVSLPSDHASSTPLTSNVMSRKGMISRILYQSANVIVGVVEAETRAFPSILRSFQSSPMLALVRNNSECGY